MTLVSIPLMDKTGRRTLHLYGLGGMFIFSIFITISLLIKASIQSLFPLLFVATYTKLCNKRKKSRVLKRPDISPIIIKRKMHVPSTQIPLDCLFPISTRTHVCFHLIENHKNKSNDKNMSKHIVGNRKKSETNMSVIMHELRYCMCMAFN